MVAGREVTPGDAASTERLMRYWAGGEGAAKYVSPGIVKGLCSNLHKRATGARPGHAASEQ